MILIAFFGLVGLFWLAVVVLCQFVGSCFFLGSPVAVVWGRRVVPVVPRVVVGVILTVCLGVTLNVTLTVSRSVPCHV